MLFVRVAPWACFFAALLLLMQSVWLLHLTFFVSDGFTAVDLQLLHFDSIFVLWAGWMVPAMRTTKKGNAMQ